MIGKVNKQLVLIVSILLLSCSGWKNLAITDVTGKYQYIGFYGISSTMELKKDMTFEYVWRVGLANGTTTGTWKLDENKITLNSSQQPGDKPLSSLKLIKREQQHKSLIHVRFRSKENSPILYANVYLTLDGEVIYETKTTEKGIAVLPPVVADSIYFDHGAIFPCKKLAAPWDSNYTYYEFEAECVNLALRYYYFTNEIWTFHKNGLYGPNSSKRKSGNDGHYIRVEKYMEEQK